MEEKIAKNQSFVIPVCIAFAAVAGLIFIKPLATQASGLFQRVPANQKCEDELPDIIKTMAFPGNGASHYDSETKECSYIYYDYKLKDVDMDEADKIKTYQWSPSILKILFPDLRIL